ncbi:hypothetical protein [Nocardia sp. NPDC024068]|uniref:hypothetical protein n=1 Tax=Nocardia sp. NPDC024068 TaxID=3157197 RepID=UPI0033F0914C
MTGTRVLLLLGGLALAGYGATLLVDLGPDVVREIALWALLAIAAHDAVFAPLCAAAGYSVGRAVPANWWGALTCGAVCTVTLILVALPVLLAPASDNASLLDRNYPVGLAVAVAVVWTLLLCGHLMNRRRHGGWAKRFSGSVAGDGNSGQR